MSQMKQNKNNIGTAEMRRRTQRAIVRSLSQAQMPPVTLEGLEARTLLSGTPVVAILDTGLDLTDTTIKAHLWTNSKESLGTTGDNDLNGYDNDYYGWNFVMDSNSISEIQGHGTLVAKQVISNGIAAATLGGQTGSDIQVMGVKVITSASDSSTKIGTPSDVDVLAKAIEYVVHQKIYNKVNVVAMTISMGGFNAISSMDPSIWAIKTAVAYATSNNIAVVVGAGNGSADNDTIPSYPANFSGVVSTASVTSNNTLSTFSNYGASTVQLAALGELTVIDPTTNTIIEYDGSEYAAGAVAGVVAGLKDAYPGSATDDIVRAVEKGVTPVTKLAGKVKYSGVLNAGIALAYLNNVAPTGVVELVGLSSVTGYAYDANSGTDPININVIVDGVTVASGVAANLARPDLNLNGNHGFQVSYDSLTPGDHTVEVDAIDYPTGNVVMLGRKSVTIHLPQLVVSYDGNTEANNSTLNLGNVLTGTDVQLTFVIKNNGQKPLTLTDVNVSDGFVVTKYISNLLEAGESDTLVIIPPTVGGVQTGTISFSTNDPSNPTYTLNLSLTASTNFVNNLYQVLLNRDADAFGLAYWSNQLTTKQMTTEQVALAIENSEEYLSNQVTQLYVTILNRAPDSDGLSSWISTMQQGTTYEQVRGLFLASDEYYAISGLSDRGVVSGYYINILNRSADTAGLTSWSDMLITGSARISVVNGLANSLEGRQTTVVRLYDTYLGRSVDSVGLADWSAALGTTMTQKGLIAKLVGSQEFFARS